MAEIGKIEIKFVGPAEDVLNEISQAYKAVTKAALEEQRLRELGAEAYNRKIEAIDRLDALLASASGDERRQELTLSAL